MKYVGCMLGQIFIRDIFGCLAYGD